MTAAAAAAAATTTATTTILLRQLRDDVEVYHFGVDELHACAHWLLYLACMARTARADDAFLSLVDTDRELTVLASTSLLADAAHANVMLPECVQHERTRWTALLVDEGDLGFDQPGIVSGLATPLAAANVPVMYVSMYSTDVVLVPRARRHDARRCLEA
eukprot:CAMPEP_0198330770 /NCGR_PEP_ID=MMETSP1450-20131203/17154_1 /TAXON_ID=753684 ORGANISM="Madagascaria erythrocladiodes, Strain CCMP3234" /NCGR_SAMPLE_ID=MMETSP1450 /ASSEMBLY_ACC=CAM_ASM_001115 /LENGTH=159 /DNA_ID=CAMNT_0044035095 /DNA_START=9 /DNA_END=484 /DNA_ORIENTATION=+